MKQFGIIFKTRRYTNLYQFTGKDLESVMQNFTDVLESLIERNSPAVIKHSETFEQYVLNNYSADITYNVNILNAKFLIYIDTDSLRLTLYRNDNNITISNDTDISTCKVLMTQKFREV